eukprot:CAMPEP_0197025026 /NCGR_PEP_ID=MMETSP1384-20130603/5465_1 /TAXON_ID=29189 /ORGANISM="Ammonia sp." /LENGTH=1058 /DNA_ID=CAMNT_0042453505 /DNA_START=61 /DNA_END=3237 /DNA_ORIENTATION=+
MDAAVVPATHSLNDNDSDNSLLMNVNRQIGDKSQRTSTELSPSSRQSERETEPPPHAAQQHKHQSPKFNLNSTLNRRQQSWVDPLEPRIQDTFYLRNKNLDTLRPRYSFLLRRPGNVNSVFLDGSDRQQSAESFFRDGTNANSESPRSSRTASWELDESKIQSEHSKFGTFKGVISRCMLNIFGVIMFLRMGFMVGECGILLSMLIVLLCASVTFITALSMCAIATNGRIEGGGLYYMISRSLGPAFGGTVGLLFGVGNAVAASMYLIGFAEVILKLTGNVFGDDKLMDIRIWSTIALLAEFILTLLGGLKLVMRSSLVLLAFITAVIFLIFVGSIYQIDESKGIIGFERGFSSGNFVDNLYSDFQEFQGVQYDFWLVLGIFFPAVTGIMAGANISSQLKNPGQSIPKGTLTAIGITTVIYIALVIVLGTIVTRKYLIADELILQSISVYEPLFLGGVFAATLSAAMTSLTSAPSILKAVIDDNIVPVLSGCCGGNNNERKMMIISVLIVFCCNLFGSLNMIAPLLTDFYLIAYGVINLSCFLSSMSKSPGWRPGFKYFNKYLALFGAVECVIFMILSGWLYAIMALFIAFLLYQYIAYIDPDVDWGKVSESRQYYDAFTAVLKLDKGVNFTPNQSQFHVKHWRPGFLVLCGDPLHRPHLIHFANTLSKSHSPTFFASICTDLVLHRTNVCKFQQLHYGNYLPRRLLNTGKKGFFDAVFAASFREGASMLMQCVGLGALRPNTLVLGYRHNWRLDMKLSNEYIEVIRDALEMGYAVIILRNFSYIHWKSVTCDQSQLAAPHRLSDDANSSDVCIELADKQQTNAGQQKHESVLGALKRMFLSQKDTLELRNQSLVELKSEAVAAMNGPFIDVWWLIDDGGLTVLLPYLMKLHRFWRDCRLRLNIIANSNAVSQEYLNVYHLMKEFRLPYDEPNLIEVDEGRQNPTPETMRRFHQLTDHGIDFQRDVIRPKVIKRWLKVSELVHQHSKHSQVIVLNLPLPTTFYKGDDRKDAKDESQKKYKQSMNGKVYFAILEMLTENLPPVMLIRGNGESALTFYSE